MTEEELTDTERRFRTQLLDSLQTLNEVQREEAGQNDDVAEWEVKLAKANAERDEAIRQMTEYSRQLGEMQGRYEATHWPGIVDEWREKAEGLAAKVDVAVVALKKIARLRTELGSDFSMGSRQSDIARQALHALAPVSDAGGEHDWNFTIVESDFDESKDAAPIIIREGPTGAGGDEGP